MTAHAMGYPDAAAHDDLHVTGRRVVATLMDGLVLGGVFGVMAAMFGTTTTVEPWRWEATLGAGATIAYGLFAVSYFILMEAYLGQTLGKMATGIQVVREDTHAVPGLGAAAIRTVLRIVDGIFGYLVAFLTVLASDKRQRLGDMAAHTLVVRK